MNILKPDAANASIGVSLVDGDADARHARQLMLRSENFNVRSYATRSALLADARSRDFLCIVLDIEVNDLDAAAMLRKMRETGWRGRAILLDDQGSEGEYLRDAERNGDQVMKRTIGDGALVTAIVASVDRGWSGRNA
jgi:FixJ family two-component response regulator